MNVSIVNEFFTLFFAFIYVIFMNVTKWPDSLDLGLDVHRIRPWFQACRKITDLFERFHRAIKKGIHSFYLKCCSSKIVQAEVAVLSGYRD